VATDTVPMERRASPPGQSDAAEESPGKFAAPFICHFIAIEHVAS
jgi:hypothetical protein